MKPLLPSFSRVSDPAEAQRLRYPIALTVTLASVMELVDTSIVNVAIPHMMGNLGATLDEIAWVSTGYVVANVIVLPISGWLSNWFGRRNYFVLSILLFVFASMMCGASTSLGMLVFWRIVQGAGGGGLLSTAQSTLYEVFPQEESGSAMAIFGLGIMVGPMLGPTLGGWITDALSWPWIFYINLPLGLLALVLALTLVPDSIYGSKAEKVDGWGLLLLAVGIGCLQTMLERGERLEWFVSREILTYAIVSASALAIFVWHELRHQHPVVELHILNDMQFAAALFCTFLTGAALYCTVFFFPVYAQTLMGYPAWDTGILVLPAAIALGLTMALVGRTVGGTPVDMRLLVAAGTLIYCYAMWGHSTFTTQSGSDDFFWPLIFRGIGLGLIFIPLNNLALGNLPPEQISNGSGFYNLTRQLGGSVGIAAAATYVLHMQQVSRGELLRHVSQYSNETAARLAALKSMLMSRGVPEALAAPKATALLDSMLMKQAAMLAFDRLFLMLGILLLVVLPLLLLMPRGRFARGGVVPDH